jgi:GT2 family glycosyltransferase
VRTGRAPPYHVAVDPSFATAEDREFCDRWIHRGGEMVRVPAAAVLHDNPLDFSTFLRRHHRYGRGAYRFHRLRRDRGSGRFRREFLWFYVFVLQACLASRRFVVRKVALVVLWQLCNLLGFFTELVSERGRRG